MGDFEIARGDTLWRVQLRNAVGVRERPVVCKYTVRAAGAFMVHMVDEGGFESRYTRRQAAECFRPTRLEAILKGVDDLKEMARTAQATVDRCAVASYALGMMTRHEDIVDAEGRT